MTAPTAGARQVELERFHRARHEVGYGTPGNDPEDLGVPELWITRADFRALGEPERIRITIEPGDRQEQEEGQ